MPLLTNLALMMRIDPLSLIFGLREFVTYKSTITHVFPDVQVKAYKFSVLYVKHVSMSDCSVLKWVEQRELRRLASNDRLFGMIAQPGWTLMDFKNNFKQGKGGEDLSNVQFNPKLLNLRPVVKGTKDAVKIPAWPETCAHVKEHQEAWLVFKTHGPISALGNR